MSDVLINSEYNIIVVRYQLGYQVCMNNVVVNNSYNLDMQ